MDARTQPQGNVEQPLRKAPQPDGVADVEVLLIQRKEKAQLYTDEVLRRAGFWVRVVTPSNVFEDGRAYPLVVFSNTLTVKDVTEIGAQFRRRSPHSRLLLVLGPESSGVNTPMFDAVLEGLEGPAALIRAARLLADCSMSDLHTLSA